MFSLPAAVCNAIHYVWNICLNNLHRSTFILGSCCAGSAQNPEPTPSSSQMSGMSGLSRHTSPVLLHTRPPFSSRNQGAPQALEPWIIATNSAYGHACDRTRLAIMLRTDVTGVGESSCNKPRGPPAARTRTPEGCAGLSCPRR